MTGVAVEQCERLGYARGRADDVEARLAQHPGDVQRDERLVLDDEQAAAGGRDCGRRLCLGRLGQCRGAAGDHVGECRLDVPGEAVGIEVELHMSFERHARQIFQHRSAEAAAGRLVDRGAALLRPGHDELRAAVARLDGPSHVDAP